MSSKAYDGKRPGGGLDQLGLGQDGRLADDVDVALVELPVAALLRPFGPPHGAYLQGPEWDGQLRLVSAVEPGQRDREVVAQPEVDQVPQRAWRGLGWQAALENLEDELLVVAALPAGEPVDVLQGGGLDPLVPEPGVDAGDGRQHMVPDGGIGGQQVPHPPGRAGVGLHVVVP
jgi:hypothetical protein